MQAVSLKPGGDPMSKLLAFDTSTEMMSIAVRDGDALLEYNGPGGALSSATLIPMVMRLLAQAGLRLDQLDAIAFGRGPGSFTGLRTACAVAQGFGFGAGVPLLPIDTLHAVAEEARERFGATRVVALLDARMDQLYAAHYAFDGSAVTPENAEPRAVSPEDVEVPAGWSQVASDVLAQKYFRKAGVPAVMKKVREKGMPEFLWRSIPDEDALAKLPKEQRFVGETSAKQVFDRLAGAWAFWGW